VSAFVLSLQPQLTRALHKSIKSQLPRCRKSMLVQYGELYHSAWKRATGPVLHTLEHDCLQDLASHAISAASPSLSSAIRHVLSVFHGKKKFKAVDEMLARIYEPILWRSFHVANATVRIQAAQLLAEAFPVQNPESSAKDFEEGLTRQIRVLDALLKDGVPRVREVGVHCVCRVLSVYLELLPLHTATSFLGLLVKHLSVDSAAASVRVAVLRGLAVVLDNHVSHPLLAARLPLLADRMHDSSESVRVAMADLLLKVRAIKGIRFYDVVALPDILARLAADEARPAVVKRLSKLLMPSYMPLSKPPAERLARLLALAQQDKHAAQVLCACT
jgi:condensin-2 complex subunit G2